MQSNRLNTRRAFAAAALALLAVAACDESRIDGAPSLSRAQAQPNLLDVIPGSFSLRPGASLQLVGWQVLGDGTRRRCGNEARWVSRDSDVATVNAKTGVVTAVADGATEILASCNDQRDMVPVFVSSAPSAAVVVRPAQWQLRPGESLQLGVEVRDAAGRAFSDRDVRWSSSDTTIALVSASGVVTARARGAVRIVAVTPRGVATSGVLLSRAALATSDAPADTTSPADSTSGLIDDVLLPPNPTQPNEPTAMTLFTERPFSARVEGWDPVETRDTTNLLLVADATAPFSTSGTTVFRYPAGFVDGVSPAIMQKQLPTNTYGTIYTVFWVKLSSNWQGNSSSTNKLLYWWIGNGPRMFMSAEGADAQPLLAEMRLQGVPDARARLLPNLQPDAQFVRGRWHKVEVSMRVNTSGAANGVVEWWLDGAKVGSYSDVAILSVTDSSRGWEQVQISPIWGGNGGVVMAEQTMAWDHIQVKVAK